MRAYEHTSVHACESARTRDEVTLITDEPNSWLGPAPLPCEEGLRRRYGLRTLTKVKAGEEMTWDYGPGFGLRPYPSKYNRRGTKRRAR